MKTTLMTLAAFAAFAVAPIDSRASDKEVQNAKTCHTCKCSNRQVALFVSGRGVNDQPAPRTITLTSSQMGQGTGITFFTGYR